MKKIFSKNKRVAFTLAEVLITLGIIGVIASITIPTLMQNTSDKQTITKLQKAYSVLSQAYDMAVVQQGGLPDTWGLDQGPQHILTDVLSPYLKVTKDCGTAAGCSIKDADSTWSKLMLADGFLLAFYDYTDCSISQGTSPALSNVCGQFLVDINGANKPNVDGKDKFMFYLTKSGIVPAGTKMETSIYDFDTHCKIGVSPASCTAWVLYNNNLDYLKCNSLSWDGPTKCP